MKRNIDIKNSYPQLILFITLLITVVLSLIDLKGSCNSTDVFRFIFKILPLLIFVSIFMLFKKHNMLVRFIAAAIIALVFYGFLFVLLVILAFGNPACVG